MPAADDARLDLIYDAAVDPSLWRRVVEEVMPTVNGEAATLSRMNIADGTGSAIVVNDDDRSAEKYFDYYYAINPIQLVTDTTAYLADWQPTILLDEEWMPRETLEASEYYNDFLRPINAHWGMLIRLGMRGMDIVSLSIGRSARGRFDQDELATMARLQPHLIRAYALSEQFTGMQAQQVGLGSALDAAAAATFLLDAAGCVIHVNAPGERLLQQGNVLTAHRGRLAPAGEHCAAAFRAMIDRATGVDGAPREGGTIRLAVPGRHRPTAVSVSPLRVERHWLFARPAAALVTVPVTGKSDGVAPDAVAASFGTTSAETRLALALIEGLTLRDVADRYRISINTARTQLASLFAKTGTHRQIDLVTLLAAAGP